MTQMNKLFQKHCINNNLEQAKKIWDIYYQSIDIHIEDEYVFRWSCDAGHLEIAREPASVEGAKLLFNNGYGIYLINQLIFT